MNNLCKGLLNGVILGIILWTIIIAIIYLAFFSGDVAACGIYTPPVIIYIPPMVI